MGDISNVLVGVATLSIRQPNDALAEWSTAQKQAGSYSAKLYKGGSGNEGSTHVQFNPTIAAVTLQDFQDDITAVGNGFSFYHRETAAILANWAQFELRFEDPASEGWVEVTVVPLQTYTGQLVWNQLIVVAAHFAGYGGNTPNGSSVFDWSLGASLATCLADLQVLFNAAEAGSGTALPNYVLARVRVELWETSPVRTEYIDTVAIDGTAYPIEPGSVTPGLSLSSPYTEIGYTEDGVTFEYTADTTDIEVEEETFPIGGALSKETLVVTCNMAESSLANINNAMAGSVLSGNILTFGDGVNKTMNIKIEGTNPDGYKTEIFLPKVVATGAVGMSFKKDEKTVVPLTLRALKPAAGKACTIVYNAA